MAFYGSFFSNDTLWNPQQSQHVRHRACPKRLKYIHDFKDGFITCVDDSDHFTESYKNLLRRYGRSNQHDNENTWQRELIGLADQVQSSLDDLQKTRLNSQRSKRSSSSKNSTTVDHWEAIDKRPSSRRLLTRRSSFSTPRPHTTKPNQFIMKNEQDLLNNNNKNKDSGLWLLPMLCHVLHMNNINEVQQWLINANPTEKRLAMELISRMMHEIKTHENENSSDQSNLNNLYWPFKFKEYQQSLKLTNDDNETCERATSPVRIVTPAKRLSTANTNDRMSTPSTISRINQSPERKSPTEMQRSHSKLLTSLTTNNVDRRSCRSSRISTCIDINDSSQASRDKMPLI